MIGFKYSAKNNYGAWGLRVEFSSKMYDFYNIKYLGKPVMAIGLPFFPFVSICFLIYLIPYFWTKSSIKC